MAYIFSVFVMLLIPVFVDIIPQSFADTQKLSGNSHGSEISLIFSNGKVSGDIILEKQTISLKDIKVIERNDRQYIIDNQNNLKILSKQITSEKYLIVVKINSDDIQTKLRFITNSENVNKNTNQRNLFDAMEQKMLGEQKEKLNSMTQRDLQLLEKQKAIDNALKIHDDRLASIAAEDAKKPHGDKTSQSILDEWQKSQKSTGMTIVVPEKIEEVQEIEPVVVNHVKIKVFLSIPHHQELEEVLRYEILVTDDSGHKFDSSYNDYIGNELSDVLISGTIKNPDGETIQSFDGITDSVGEYLGTFLIPEESTTRGEYVISADAIKSFEDDTSATSSNSGIFFVFPSDSGSNNQAPWSNAGTDQSVGLGVLVTLDGYVSTDSEGMWTQSLNLLSSSNP